MIRFTALFVLAVLFVNADAFAQLTKLNVGYVGVTSDNAAAFIARETGHLREERAGRAADLLQQWQHGGDRPDHR